MTFYPSLRAVSALAIVAALTACNASVVASATPTGSAAGAKPATSTQPGGPGGPGGMQPPGGMPGGPGMGGPGGGVASYFAQLDLTADQQAQLDAITEDYRPEMGQPPAGGAAPADTAGLLTAATLDEAALRTAVTQASQRPDAEIDELAMLQAYRAVLDDAQRADLATLLRAAPLQAGGPPPGGGPGMQLRTEGLALTTDQQAKLDAFQAALGTNAQGGPGGRLNLIAVADYFESGDAATLDADASAAYPVDALVALAKALSATQRGALFAAGAPGLPGAGPRPL